MPTCRVTEIIKLLRAAAPEAHIVIQGLLPRGSAWVGPKEWKWPNRFTKPIEAVNNAFEVRLPFSACMLVKMHATRYSAFSALRQGRGTTPIDTCLLLLSGSQLTPCEAEIAVGVHA